MITGEQLLDHLYYKKLPKVYRDMDSALKTYPLKRYLSSLIDGGYAPVIADIEDFLKLLDPEKCPTEFLPTLCQSFGLEYFDDLDDIYQRKFLANIGEIIKRRGTYSCVTYIVRALTGLSVDLEYIKGEYLGVVGRHLIINLRADTLEQVVNMGTHVAVVERYITAQIPYYITPHVTTQITGQTIENNFYMGSVVTQYASYIIS